MKKFLLSILLIVLTLLLIADLTFPVIISFYSGNFWLLFLYAVWWLPVIGGFMLYAASTTIILEAWD